jgi:hypothetical protein
MNTCPMFEEVFVDLEEMDAAIRRVSMDTG